MSESTTPNADPTDEASDDRPLASRAQRRLSGTISRGRQGTIALLAGGILLARAVRAKTRLRGALQGVAGLALLGVGVRKRLSREGSFEADVPERADPDEATGTTSGSRDTPARTDHGRSEGTNPRDVTDDPSVETADDEGRVEFTTDQDAEPRAKPHLDEEDADDPRLHEEDDEIDVDISEAHMADEASEATGPQPEQAYPAQTEDTEPEPSPDEDASHMESDAASSGDEDEKEPAAGEGDREDDDTEDDDTEGGEADEDAT